MKRILFLILSAVMLLSLFSCSSEPVEIIYDDSPDEYDFLGEEIIINTYWKPAYGDSYIGDYMLARYDEIEEKFNVTVNLKGQTYGYSTTLFTMTLAEEKYADIMSSHLSDLTVSARTGLLVPLNYNNYLDITDEKFGTDCMKEASSVWTEDVYGVYPQNWALHNISLAGHCLVNYQLIHECGVTSPYELLENGQWNWYNFEELCKVAVKSQEGRYGVTTEHDEMVSSVMFMNGCEFVKYNERTGLYEFGFATEAALHAAQWVEGLVSQKLVCHGTSSNGINAQTVFCEGGSMFHVGNGYIGTGVNGIESLEEGFGFIPMAFGDDNKEQVWNVKFDMRQNFFCVPNSEANSTDIDFPILDYLFDPLGEDLDWKSYFRRYVFDTDESADCFIKMADCATNACFNMQGDARLQLSAFASILSGQSAAQQIESLASSAQAIVDEFLNNK